ncbi:MAG: hypothetical protein LBD85_02300 [Oscillospiraceae bacterium]|jgi:hypothetical protein|nr:hypothetical protein [Oscillospiraceae bacterium]
MKKKRRVKIIRWVALAVMLVLAVSLWAAQAYWSFDIDITHNAVLFNDESGEYLADVTIALTGVHKKSLLRESFFEGRIDIPQLDDLPDMSSVCVQFLNYGFLGETPYGTVYLLDKQGMLPTERVGTLFATDDFQLLYLSLLRYRSKSGYCVAAPAEDIAEAKDMLRKIVTAD